MIRGTGPGSTVRHLGLDDAPAILAVLRDDGGYAERVNGRTADGRDVDELLHARPAAVDASRHHVLGWFDGDELLAVASLVVDWPEAGTTHLGLLQVRADHQRRGVARAFPAALRSRFPGRWRLGVVDANADAVEVWRRLGYRPEPKPSRWTSPDGIDHRVVIMTSDRAC